ncbi:MAG: sigma-E processing peptidase SpoIIGA [Christensenellaceae bacterium]|jgi:stage II sporulation protein GA (sporulation sigma-E factor processing peptidase)|nr:sigma-E processing peptidase SpoIIGA [Christensenellaceae bacterium]
MEIMVEIAVIENLLVDFVLLYFACKTIKQRIKTWRILVASIIGAAFAIALPLFSFNDAADFLIKLFIGAFMCYIVVNNNFVRFGLCYLLFTIYTFAFGGAVFAFGSIWVLPLMGIIFIILVSFLNLRHSVGQNMRDCVIYYGGNKFKILSFADTGNRLIDPRSRAPVCIISLSLFLKMFPDVKVENLIMNRLGDEGIEDGHYINFATVADSSQKMFVFAPNKLQIDGKVISDVRLGVATKKISSIIKYDAILNGGII